MDGPGTAPSSLPKTANSITASAITRSNQKAEMTSQPSSPTQAIHRRRKSGSPLNLLQTQETTIPNALKSPTSAPALSFQTVAGSTASTAAGTAGTTGAASGPADVVANSAETGQASTTPNIENSLTAHQSGVHPSPFISASAFLPQTQSSASRTEGEQSDANGGNPSKPDLTLSSSGAASLKEMSRPSSSHAMATDTITTTPNAAPASTSEAAAVADVSQAVNQTPQKDGAESTATPGSTLIAARKGGHSLRKRARVDYTFENIDNEPTVPNSSSAQSVSNRSKKRRLQNDDLSDHPHSAKRRVSSAGVESSPTSSRRRNPARKTSEVQSYREPFEEDQIPVMDTIEVGGVAYNEEPQVDETDVQQYEPESTAQDHTLVPSVQDSTSADAYAQSFPGYYEQPAAGEMAWAQDGAAAGSYQVPTGDFAPDNAASYSEGPEAQLQVESYQNQSSQMAVEPSPQPIDPLLTAEYCPRSGGLSLPQNDNASQEQQTSFATSAGESAQDGDAALQSATASQQLETKPTAPESLEHSAGPLAEAAIIEARGSGDETSLRYTGSSSQILHQMQEAEPATFGGSEQTEENGDLAGKESPVAQNESTPDTSLSQNAESQLVKGSPEAKESIEFDRDQGRKQQYHGDSTETTSFDRLAYADHPAVRKLAKTFPAPTGRWAHLTPYVQDQYIALPEREDMTETNDASDQPSDDKGSDKDAIDAEPLVEDNEDGAQAPTPLPVTPRAGSPVQGSNQTTNLNSPRPVAEDQDDVAGSESQEEAESENHWKFRKVRDPQDFFDAFENWEQLNKEDLLELCNAAAVSMRSWREEYEHLRSVVEDEENAQRRRAYEAKPNGKAFVIKGHHADIREPLNEQRYLQEQDKLMAAAYSFEYESHGSKIGKQDPEAQRAGNRGRALRSQPKQTAKATETEEVTGKRQRKPVQLYDGSQDVSRASTPVPGGRSRRRRGPHNVESEASVPPTAVNAGDEENSGTEAPPAKRRKRAPRTQVVAAAADDDTSPPASEMLAVPDVQPAKQRRTRKPTVKADQADETSVNAVKKALAPEPNREGRRILTLKLRPGMLQDQTLAATDSYENRPTTSSSEASGNTVESAYTFRPKRQKRFRDEPEEEPVTPEPPRKRVRKRQGSTNSQKTILTVESAAPQALSQDSAKPEKKPTKIKVVRKDQAQQPVAPSESRTGTPMSLPNSTEDGDDKKDYSAMTKSEKMSASMKSRWANGNMAGAVEKRKATLAAKKAAQVAAEQKVGPLAPKPKKAGKKDSASQGKSTPRSTPSATPQPTPQQQHPHQNVQSYVNPAPPEIPPQYQHAVPQQPMSYHHQQPVLHQHGHPGQAPAPGHQGFMQNQPPAPQHGHQQPQTPQQSRASSFMHGLPGMGLFYNSK